MKKKSLLRGLWYRIKDVAIWLFAIRHIFVACLILGNSGLIFHTIYGLPINLIKLFNVKNYEQINHSFLTNAPYFMLGVFLILSSLGLFFRARISWVISFILMIITLLYTAQFHPEHAYNIDYGFVSLLILFVVRKHFSKSSVAASSIFALISIIALMLTSTYGALYFGSGFAPKITSLLTGFYYAIETMSTVGYGDIVPVTEPARIFTISVIVSGITVFATSATTVLGPVVNSGLERLVKGKSNTMNRTNHFIICGLSSLAINVIKQLSNKKQPITVIVSPRTQQVAQDLLEGLDVVIGDYSDGATLKQAGVMNAKAVLALSNDDADNAFIVLAAIELDGSAKTVALVNDSKNLNKVKSVNPNVVISPQLFASDILARLLNGETIDSESIVSSLLNSVHGISENEIAK